MAKFVKKPVFVEAVRASELIKNANESNCPAQPVWIRKLVDDNLIIFSQEYLIIQTTEGSMRADKEDWVIKEPNGEVYPCKLDIFEKTYESLE